MFEILILKQAQADKNKVSNVPALKKNATMLIEILRINPFQTPPTFEKLQGEMQGYYSRRINKQHRLVYSVEGNLVKIISMWLHYDNKAL